MIHSVYGETKLLPYSGRQGEYINSVSRAGLNVALINKAEMYDGVQFIFNERCEDFDFKIGEATFESGRTIRADTFIATDGAGSAVRNAMTSVDGFKLTERWLEHGYKELHIPSANGAFSIEKNALHIWPRHKFMMIALPNFDGSFTCTLFIAHESKKRDTDISDVHEVREIKRISSFDKPDDPAFDHLTDADALLDLFNREFSDAVPLMPTLAEDFFRNPTGNLGTVKCWPWHVGGKALLLGDSAHAVVPSTDRE
jgi:kynurenine 3-monooxygenase